MIVSLIVGSANSNPNGISFVDGKIEDQIPDAPERDGDNWKNNGSEHVSSSTSSVLSEEVNHLTGSNGRWDQKEEGNENEPPWKVLIQ